MRILLIFVAVCTQAADWPTYRGDDTRSGVSLEQLNLPLKQSWIHQPLHAPRPAWRGPAKADLYNKQFNCLVSNTTKKRIQSRENESPQKGCNIGDWSERKAWEAGQVKKFKLKKKKTKKRCFVPKAIIEIPPA